MGIKIVGFPECTHLIVYHHKYITITDPIRYGAVIECKYPDIILVNGTQL